MKNLAVRFLFFVFVLLVSCATNESPIQTAIAPIEVTATESVPQSTSTLPPTHTSAPIANSPTLESNITPSLPPTALSTPTITVPSYPAPTGRIYFFWDPTTFSGGVPPAAPKQNLYALTPRDTPANWQIDTLLEDLLDWSIQAPSFPSVVLSADQTKLAFTVARDFNSDGDVDSAWGGDVKDIYVYNLVDGSLIKILESDSLLRDLSGLADNQTLTYGWGKEIFQIHLDSLIPELLIGPLAEDIGRIVSSPDDEKLAVRLTTGHNEQLLFFSKDAIELDFITIEQLTSPFNTIWSPDSLWFASNKVAAGGLFVVDATTFEVVLSLDSGFGTPAWSLDSSQLAFVQRMENQTELAIWDTTTFTTVTLLRATEMISPVWSPDGTDLAVSSVQDGKTRLSVLNVLSNNLRVLLDESDLQITAIHSWSPEGEWLLFSGTKANERGLYIIHEDGDYCHLLLPIPENTIPPLYFFWLPE